MPLFVTVLILAAAGGLVEARSGQEAPKFPSRSTAYYHYLTGKLEQLAEDFPGALERFQAALAADPESLEVRREIALTYFHLGEIRKAVETCRDLIALAPGDPEGYLLLGRIYYGSRAQENLREKAIAAFEKVLELAPERNEALQSLAELYFEAGEYEASARAFHRLRERNPAMLGYYYSEAQALAEAGRLDEAITTLQDGLRIRSDIPEYLLFLGELLQRRGRLDEAISVYRRGLEQGPEPRLHRALAGALVEEGKAAEAISLLERLETVFPQDAALRLDLARAYRQLRRLDKSREILEALVSADAGDAQVTFELATLLAEMGERDEAVRLFESLLAMDRGDVRAFRPLFLSNLSLIRLQERRFAEAIRLQEQAFELEPRNFDLRLRLLNAYREAGQTKQALELAEKFREEMEGQPFFLATYAQILASAGRGEEALRLLAERRAQDPNAREFLWLAESQLLLEQERYAEAERAVREALQEFPASRRLQFQQGAVLERMGNYQGAETVFRRMLEEEPDAADVMNYLGYMFAERGVRLDEAVEFLERAVSLDPYNGAYQDSLGWAYYQRGELEKAEAHLLRAARLELNDPVILEHLGDLYARKGDVVRAQAYFRQALSLHEKASEAERVKRKLGRLETAQSR
ncbi:MAG: tetratricopeptide repeat protein [Acidobacteriota bacterium]